MGLYVEREQGVGAGFDFRDPQSPLSRYYLSTGSLVAALILAAVFYWLNVASLWHTDIWGHLKFGERLLREHQFPAGEPFCPFAEKTVDTVNYCWLSQALFAQTYRVGASMVGGDVDHRLAGGSDALRVLHSVCGTGWLALLWWALKRRTHSGALASAGIVFIILIRFFNLGIARPQVVAEVLAITVVLLVTWSAWQARAGVVAALILWANAHGSYPIGIVFLGGLLVGRAIDRRFSQLFADAEFRGLLITLITALAGIAFLNPEGPRIFAITMEMASNTNVRAMDEWQPITSPLARLALCFYLLCVTTIAVSLVAARGRVSAQIWLLLLAFGIPPILHQRALVWFIAFTPWLALPGFATWLERRRPDWWSSVPCLRKTIGALLVWLMVLFASIPVQNLLRRQPSPLPEALSAGTPWAASLAIRDQSNPQADAKLVQALATHYPEGKYRGTVFASETLGDFFLWLSSPPHPVFVYSHVHLFNQDHWKRCTQIRSAAASWRELLDWGKVNLVVVEVEQNKFLCDQLRRDPEWLITTDEAGDTAKPNPRNRLFVALRKRPK